MTHIEYMKDEYGRTVSVEVDGPEPIARVHFIDVPEQGEWPKILTNRMEDTIHPETGAAEKSSFRLWEGANFDNFNPSGAFCGIIPQEEQNTHSVDVGGDRLTAKWEPVWQKFT